MPAELTKEQVEELEVLLSKATPGQLEVRENYPHGRDVYSQHEDWKGEPVASHLFEDDAKLFVAAINALRALLTLARSAPSADLVKLGEAAVKFDQVTDSDDDDEFDEAEVTLHNAARTFARTVEDQRAKALTELAELDADEIERMSTTLLGAEGQL